jgi:protein associated with RNAse G/E
MNKNEITIKEIHENLKGMGYRISLENLVKMKPTELKKFYKKARKAFELYYSVERTIAQLSEEVESE